MSRHTPGPWHAELVSAYGPDEQDSWYVFGRDTSYEATIAECWSGEHDNAANARLISAAPDLLDALEELLALDSDAGWKRRTQVADKAIAAIAKARGE